MLTSNQMNVTKASSVVANRDWLQPQNAPKNAITDEDFEGDYSGDKLNVDLLYLNQYLMVGYSCFEKGDLDAAMENYNKALNMIESSGLGPSKAIDKIACLRSNIAVILFMKGEYARSNSLLEETLRLLKTYEKSLPVDTYRSQVIRVLGNLCVVNILNQKYDHSVQYNNEVMKFIQNTDNIKQRTHFRELLYIYYRCTSLNLLNQQFGEVDESKYDRHILGWYYQTMGINKELLNESENAIPFYAKALEVWKFLNETKLAILALMHLISLHQALHHEAESREYEKFLNQLMNQPEYKGLDPEVLFKDYDVRLDLAREITVSLQKMENSIVLAIGDPQASQSPFQDGGSVMKSRAVVVQQDETAEGNLWRFALLLRMKNSIKGTRLLLNQPNNSKEEKDHLTMALRQMEQAMAAIETEKNEMIIEKLKSQTFTKEAVTLVKGNINKIRRCFVQLAYRTAWRSLYQYSHVDAKLKALEKLKQDPSSFYQVSLSITLAGDFIIKCNANSNGRSKKFVKLFPEGILRWSKDAKSINNPSKFRSYNFTEVEGILYGKHSNTFRKSFNKKLEPWLCMSLVLRNRTLDFFFKEEQMNTWFYAMSYYLKKFNVVAPQFSYGKYLWRKLRYLLYHFFLESQVKDKKKHRIEYSFAKAVIAYRDSQDKPEY